MALLIRVLLFKMPLQEPFQTQKLVANEALSLPLRRLRVLHLDVCGQAAGLCRRESTGCALKGLLLQVDGADVQGQV